MKRKLFILILAVCSLNVFAQNAELVANYGFEGDLTNSVTGSVEGECKSQASGTLPSFDTDAERGKVIHTYFGYNDASSMSYVEFTNPLMRQEFTGATISLWVNRLTHYPTLDAIWGVYDPDATNTGRFYLTPNAYLGYNGIYKDGENTGTGWFDCNHPGEEDVNATGAIDLDTWTMVTVTIDSNDGFAIFINGKKEYDTFYQNTWGAQRILGETEEDISATAFNYGNVIDLLKASSKFYLGYGSWWGSAPLLIDDLLIYKRVLTAAEIKALYDPNDDADLVANYGFDGDLINSVTGSEEGERKRQASGTLPSFDTDAERDKVIHTYFGYESESESESTISYVEFANPLMGQEFTGATISLWVNRLTHYPTLDAIWGVYDPDATNTGRFYLTPNAYLGYNGIYKDGENTGTGWFDCNHPGEEDVNATGAIDLDTWTMVTVTIDSNDGFAIFIDGKKEYDTSYQNTWGAQYNFGTATNIDATAFNYGNVIDLLKASSKFYLGYGSWWGSAPLLIDDLLIYKRVLTAAEIKALYDPNDDEENPNTTELNRHQEFVAGENEEDSGTSTFYYYYSDDQTREGSSITVSRLKTQITIDGTSKYVYEASRFIAENDNNEIPASITISLNDQSNLGDLIANPLMSHLNFRALLNDNTSSIENYFRLWNGTNSYVVRYDGATTSAGTGTLSFNTATDTTECLIAPMQSFFVKRKNPATTLTINTANVSAVKGGETGLRSGALSSRESLKVIAQSTGGASAILLNRGETVEEYGIPKVFTFLQDVPELYIIDEQALEIKDMNKTVTSVPVGIRALDAANITLTFAGLNTLTESVSLYDLKDDRNIALGELQNTYSFTNDADFNSRFLLVFAPDNPTIVNTPSANNLLILHKDNIVRTIASPNDRIESVKVYNLQGRLVTEKNNLSAVVYDMTIEGKGVYVVEVFSEYSRSVKKIINH